MAEPTNPAAGGCILAVAIVLGALIGAIMGQPTIGVLAGVGMGALIAIVIWLRDRG